MIYTCIVIIQLRFLMYSMRASGEVARELQAEGRWERRARLPGRLGALAREIEEQARILSRRS